MIQSIAHIALVVDDYDEAIKFYTEKLNFTLLEDTPQSETKRWVLVAPKGLEECCLLLAKGAGEEQRSRIGNQTGRNVSRDGRFAVPCCLPRGTSRSHPS